MKSKVLINPQRKRKIPKHFSWVDHRLVRQSYIKKCSADALAMYLFLITVGDYEGLSYYGDESIHKYLSLSAYSSIKSCRDELISAGLIAFNEGLYQVLDLGEVDTSFVRFNAALKQGKSLHGGSLGKNKAAVAESVGSVIDKMFGAE